MGYILAIYIIPYDTQLSRITSATTYFYYIHSQAQALTSFRTFRPIFLQQHRKIRLHKKHTRLRLQSGMFQGMIVYRQFRSQDRIDYVVIYCRAIARPGSAIQKCMMPDRPVKKPAGYFSASIASHGSLLCEKSATWEKPAAISAVDICSLV